jgi:SMI1/KNR4 family protein SUKH-1
MNIRDLEKYLDNKGCELRGCSMREVAKIETFFSVKLPLAYREFLVSMGKDAGTFMKGSSVFYNEIFELKEGSIELLKEDNFKPLPGNAFVFWMHQGYQFAFFNLDEGDNPPVYFYYQGEGYEDFERKEDSFTDFLEKQLVMSGLE